MKTTFNCPQCSKPVDVALLLLKDISVTSANAVKCPSCSAHIELPEDEYKRLLNIARQDFEQFQPQKVNVDAVLGKLGVVQALNKIGGFKVEQNASGSVITVANDHVARELLQDLNVHETKLGIKLLRDGALQGNDAEQMLS